CRAVIDSRRRRRQRGRGSPAAAMDSPRRALGQAYAGNGLLPPRRSSSVESAEEAESEAWASRPDRRSYLLSIRPENSLSSSRFSLSSLGRSTFCAIISQLTEETQPLFETTIKSRSVSEDSDAKFTCIVTGYPQPEVTWYKDDEEMDRYCGLPKYEIFRHGNRHTLQLYKCREEDAGIYQASARNHKGIVSCSGVLEVGTMTEFKIHQKWFAKIKRKAEEKLREIEQGKKRGKENVEVEKLQRMSPDRLQRKRRLTRDLSFRSGTSSWEKEDVAKVHVADSQSRLRKDMVEPKETSVNAMSGFSNNLITPLKAEVTANGDVSLESGEENGNSFLAYIYETVEDLKAKPMAKDSAAKKKKKVLEPPAAKQEASKKEESGREKVNPSTNARFAPPVPLRRSARLRVASDQEVENIPKIKEPAKPMSVDTKTNANQRDLAPPKGEMHFSLKEMYFNNQMTPTEGMEEAGASEEAMNEAVLQPGGTSRRAERIPPASEVQKAGHASSEGQQEELKSEGNKAADPQVTGPGTQSANDFKHPAPSPALDTAEQASTCEEFRKEPPISQETRESGERTSPELRPQEPPRPLAPAPDHAEPSEELPAFWKQAEGHSQTPEGGETQRGLLNEENKSQVEREPLLNLPSAPAPGDDIPLEQSAHPMAIKGGESKEAAAPLPGSQQQAGAEERGAAAAAAAEPSPGAESCTAAAAEPSPEAAVEELAGMPLVPQDTEMPAPISLLASEEEPPPSPAAGMLVPREAPAAPQSSPGEEAAAGGLPAGAQLLPHVSQEMEVKMADESALQVEFPVRSAEEESAQPLLVEPQRKEGGEQRTAASSQEPAAPSGTSGGVPEVQPQVPLVLPSPEKPQEVSLEEKIQHKNLVTSLKNYLLLLLKMSDSSKEVTKEDAGPREEEQPAVEEAALPEIGIAGLSPRTSRRVLEKVQNNQLFQTAENLLLTPRTSRRITGMINEEFMTSKEMLASRPVPPKRRSRVAPEAERPLQLSVPSIVVGGMPTAGAGQSPHVASDLHPASRERESHGDPLATLPCATPEELASGARRKIYLPKAKQVGDEEDASTESQGLMRSPTASPRQSRKNAALLQTPVLAPAPPAEQRSPTLMRKMATLEVPKLYEEPTGDSSSDREVPEEAKPEVQPAESKKESNPFKAPQVIRKIRAEQFSDASGNLKLWCQFFNILSDSKLMWYKDEIPVAETRRSAGDEGQAALAIVQASQKDCGVYQCVISNEYGTDSTDFLLSPEVLSGFILREEIEVGEEIEMTPMVFAKGLADSGYWGDKFFGRVVSEDMEVGAGFLRKACRARAIYGLEPVFESGRTCVIKVHNFIVFGTKNENSLIEKNYDITIQECKIQNSSREYCKIFAAETRAVPDFGAVPEIIPLYLIYRPANNIPYATAEEDLGGPCEQYCVTERDGSLVARGTSEVVLKCCTFQHWVYQWTNGNILVTDMEGVGWKVTNVRIATNLKGYQGLKESCFPSLLEQFAATHQCNHYCAVLGLKTLEPVKPKGSKSPSTGRKSTQSSPQLPKKGLSSPQGTRKASVSPKSSRKGGEAAEAQAASKHRAAENGKPGHPQ
ncbi:ALPK3 kinase, partial [Eudromia elegans]|nr:ALPK3 kinase [Eudromia elegans]